MSEKYKIAIVGSGPAGLSAAARAGRRQISHVLLERAPYLCSTIYKYQKRKLVMATPVILPLRSDVGFEEGSREKVLEGYDHGVTEAGTNVRLNAEVAGIAGSKGNFVLTLGNGEKLEAENVLLAIGLQGNLRKLTVPGGDLPFIQYSLDDPDEYQNENIVVVGGGDAGIENALGLCDANNVTIINNQAEFAYAKPPNAALVLKAIKEGRMQAFMDSQVARVEPGMLYLNTREGEASIPVDRIIARIGALPPRQFVEACGVTFSSKAPTAVPEVSEAYESNVPGLYIIGALAGYPLIKNCMNQGYEVVESILGNPLAPADEPLIQKKIDEQKLGVSVSDLIEIVRERSPLFSALTKLQIRELLLQASVHNVAAGNVIFERNDYTNSLYAILQGSVEIEINPSNPDERLALEAGAFFGEMGLISGRRRTATVRAKTEAALLELPRNAMIRLTRSVPDIKRQIDEVAIVRQFQTYIAPGLGREDLADVLKVSSIVAFKPGEVMIKEAAEDDSVFLIRSGAASVSRLVDGRDVVLSYVPAGHYVGEMAMLTRARRSATVKASVATEAIKIEAEAFRALLKTFPDLQSAVENLVHSRGIQNAREIESARSDRRGSPSQLMEFLLQQGMGEATDVLLIDESLCVGCNNCEKACAETHAGISRLDREAGPAYASVHFPTSCRHCENPHCMKDCPPDALGRTKEGEVFIDQGKCIGCGNCERNCPYGVIHMSYQAPPKPPLWQWLLFGRGHGPGEDPATHDLHLGAKKAVKCDLCKDIAGGPACVRACPTGAAIRVKPERLFALAHERGR
ncbi:MAG: cyclic nucleotide-binding domain-containing protein [Proteobacteria bacterium]|nr:cyclic nucleotide-binding domain-containing protein [Pseudomonadota bacterium]